MTFQANKNQNLQTENQEGVTLILAILLLSAILAIAFSLTTIIFIEVRSSADLQKTEGSLYAATGVGEQAFFKYLRKVSNPEAGYVSYFLNNVKLNGQPQVSSTSPTTFNDKILTGSSFSSTKKKYDFCGPDASAEGCGFGKVVVKYLLGQSSDFLYAYVCEWDPEEEHDTPPCTEEGEENEYWIRPISDPGACGGVGQTGLEDNGSAQLGLTISCASWTLEPDLQQQLILTNPSGSNTIYYSISSYEDVQGSIGKGLPYVGKTAVIINTQSGPVGRKIQVEVPSNK